jgi:hypothetical protein
MITGLLVLFGVVALYVYTERKKHGKAVGRRWSRKTPGVRPGGILKVLRKCAGAITGKTPLDSDSWDDPEDWQTEAVALAHGFEALDAKLQRETV